MVVNSPVTNSVQSNIESSGPLSSVLGEVHRVNLGGGFILHISPGKEIGWEEFIKVSPPFSIALDGLVRGMPRYTEHGVRANFNHHQDVDRLATRSTAAQIMVAIKQGLMDPFHADGNREIHIFVNDPDQDTCLAVWLLVNWQRVAGNRSEPLINKLVNAEDLLDTTAGAFPYLPSSQLMKQLAKIFDPYVQARMAGRIHEMKGPEMANVIASVCQNISDYSIGNGGELELDTRFDELGGGDGWRMIVERGFYARTELYNRGIKAFVSFRGESNGHFHYSIGKMSPYVTFPILDIYKVLNQFEGLDGGSGICWNGGDTIGGSPRRPGSRLSPHEVEAVINHALRNSGVVH